jgi:uncharacterized protein with FMN-binding domain
MNMNRIPRLLTSTAVIFALFVLGGSALASPPAKHHNHHDGKQMLGDNLKHDGPHDIDHKGKYTATADVRNGKISGVRVKNSDKGNIPVKKYKTHKKMAQAARAHIVYASLSAQMEDMGTVYIGYAYVDDFGNEEIYWFPYDMIVDGDTGAVEYVAED